MIRLTLRLAALVVSILALATTAFAQTAAGDWTGAVTVPPMTYHLGVHIDGAAGALKGTIGSNETGRWDTPLDELKLEGGVLSFSVPTTKTTFIGRWDAAAAAWTGDYVAAGKTYPLKLTAGVPAPLPTVAGIDGRWEGTLEIAAANAKLRLVLRVASDIHGTRLVMDSPDQAANDIPGANIRRDGAHVAFDIQSLSGHYEGDLSTDGGSLTGAWSQGPQSLPLVLQHVSLDASVKPPLRPQTPKKPYPYAEEDVVIDNPAAPGVKLACTLSLPPGAKPHPGALLITGSGPEDRDETIFGHKPFLVLSDHLTRKGIAVLRCDDRGMAKSMGVFMTAQLKDFASDVRAELAFLRTRKEIDAKRIA